MKKKCFRMAALVLALVMMALAGCATPEPKPGGLELTEQQLAEISDKVYPAPLPRFDMSIWETVFEWEAEMKRIKDDPPPQVIYATILQQVDGKYNAKDYAYGYTYYEVRIEKVVFGTMEQGKTITFHHEGGYDEETGVLMYTHPDFVPLNRGDKMLLTLVYSKRGDDAVDQGLMYFLSGTAVEIDGKEYLVYRSSQDTPVKDLLPNLANDEVKYETVYSKFYDKDMEIAIVEPSAMEREIKAFLEKD